MRFFALIIEENELGNLFNCSRSSVSLPEDDPASLRIGRVHVQVPAPDLLRLEDMGGFPRARAAAPLALNPVHASDNCFRAASTEFPLQSAYVFIASLADSIEKRLEVLKPPKALRKVMLAGIGLMFLAVDAEHFLSLYTT
jgi:hypothetical protein